MLKYSCRDAEKWVHFIKDLCREISPLKLENLNPSLVIRLPEILKNKHQ